VELSELLERLATLSRAERRAAGAELKLNPAQLDALTYLSRCNRYSDTPAALADFLGCSRGTVSQTLLALERKGFVEKAPDSADRRVVHCSLTAPGKRALAAAAARDPLARGLEQLSEEDKDRVTDLLLPVLASAQEARGGLTFGLCKTCVHFRRRGRRYQCGLTGEPLTTAESKLICREHQPSGA